MQCNSCQARCCSSDFPAAALCETCDHPPTFCLACLGGVKQTGRCPECGGGLQAEDMERLMGALRHRNRECAAFHDLDTLKKREEEAKRTAHRDLLGIDDGQPQSGDIEVTVLDGRRCKLRLCRRDRLSSVKRAIETQLAVPAGKQRLLFRGRDLTAEDDPCWGTLGVPFGEALQLVIIMYETSSGSNVRRLSFDLSWRPTLVTLRSGKVTCHHLNGSCILLNRFGRVLDTVDFQKRSCSGVQHGGPSSKHSPKQSLEVDMRMLPSDCSYLFFTLSGFAPGGVTLAVFQDPSVHLRDRSSAKILASYTADRCRTGEAVVLCCAVRDERTNEWRVQQVGRGSSGNTKNYDGLYQTVRSLVDKM
ncbi:unnamed protein product [Effrenium voratum]|nr:unnamed protein product [Effrenium voratum]